MEYTALEQLPLVLSVGMLAKVLNIGLNTAYALVRSGQIRVVRIGKIYKIPKDAVMDFLGIQKTSTNCA